MKVIRLKPIMETITMLNEEGIVQTVFQTTDGDVAVTFPFHPNIPKLGEPRSSDWINALTEEFIRGRDPKLRPPVEPFTISEEEK